MFFHQFIREYELAWNTVTTDHKVRSTGFSCIPQMASAPTQPENIYKTKLTRYTRTFA